METLSIIMLVLSVLGLVLFVLSFTYGMSASLTPSTYTFKVGWWGLAMFIVFGVAAAVI